MAGFTAMGLVAKYQLRGKYTQSLRTATNRNMGRWNHLLWTRNSSSHNITFLHNHFHSPLCYSLSSTVNYIPELSLYLITNPVPQPHSSISANLFLVWLPLYSYLFLSLFPSLFTTSLSHLTNLYLNSHNIPPHALSDSPSCKSQLNTVFSYY